MLLRHEWRECAILHFVIGRKKGIWFRYLCLCCSTVHCIHECTTDYLQKGESSCYICYYLSMMWSHTTLSCAGYSLFLCVLTRHLPCKENLKTRNQISWLTSSCRSDLKRMGRGTSGFLFLFDVFSLKEISFRWGKDEGRTESDGALVFRFSPCNITRNGATDSM